MLPKSQRLTRFEILQLKKTVPPKHTPLGLVYVSSGPAKCAVIVTTKVSKKAVSRNQLRRKVYRLIRDLNPVNTQLIIYLSKNCQKYSPNELTTLLKALYERHD